MTNWVDLPRLETTSKRISNTVVGESVEVINLDYGINLYKIDCQRLTSVSYFHLSFLTYAATFFTHA